MMPVTSPTLLTHPWKPTNLGRQSPGETPRRGEDRISYAMLRHAGPSMEQEMLHLMYQSYTSRAIATPWRDAAIVSIPKAGDVTQYRPISLLSCIAKTMERVLYTQLEWVIGDLNHHLLAFHRGKGTRDCVETLLSEVVDRKAVAVFLELLKAF